LSMKVELQIAPPQPPLLPVKEPAAITTQSFHQWPHRKTRSLTTIITLVHGQHPTRRGRKGFLLKKRVESLSKKKKKKRVELKMNSKEHLPRKNLKEPEMTSNGNLLEETSQKERRRRHDLPE
jgi:hypothetical protein